MFVIFTVTISVCAFLQYIFYLLNGVYQVFKKEPSHFPFFFKCVMEAVLAGDEAGLTLKEQTVLLVFLDHCFNSLVCTTTLIFICNFGNVSIMVRFSFMFSCQYLHFWEYSSYIWIAMITWFIIR